MLVNIHTHRESKFSVEILNEAPVSSKTFFSAGIHPMHANADEVENVLNLTSNPNCLAIGECGLDKIISIPMDLQLAAFEAQITLSEQLKIPLILHCVKAWNEAVQIRRKLNPEQPWIFHGFRKTTILENVLNEGLMISIGTAVLHDKRLQEIIHLIPDDKLFLETDNDPDHSIGEVYVKVAELKNISMENLEANIYANFTKHFLRFEPFV